MDISSIAQLNNSSGISALGKINSSQKSTGFDDLLQSMLNLIGETNDLSNKAQEEEIKYAAGADNTLELLVAQNKANLSLSFTTAVRDKVVEAYKEIMNLQF